MDNKKIIEENKKRQQKWEEIFKQNIENSKNILEKYNKKDNKQYQNTGTER